MFKNETCNIIFLIFLLMFFLSTIPSCKGLFEPDDPEPYPEPIFLDVVEVKYERVFDTPNCPPLHIGDPFRSVYIQGLTSRTVKLEETGENLFYTKLEGRVHVNYPYRKYGGDPRKVFVIDNVWFDQSSQGNRCYHFLLLIMYGLINQVRVTVVIIELIIYG